MQRQIRRFRSQVEEYFGGRPGPGDRYPETLRALAVEVAAVELARGTRLAAVAEELGVGAVTLRRWVEAAPARSASLRAVEVVKDEGTGAEEPRSSTPLVLVTASGHRVEGLSLAEVSWLLESLA